MPSSAKDTLQELHRMEYSSKDTHDEQTRRAFQRFDVRGQAKLRPAQRNLLNDQDSIDIQLRDIGRGGLGFVCSQSLPSGSIWNVQFIHQGYVIDTRTIQVRHVSELEPGCFVIGTQFIINDGLMALLGVSPAEIDRHDLGDREEEADLDSLGFAAPEDLDAA